MTTNATAQTVLNFWFDELQPEQWFKKDPALDKQIKTRFKNIVQQAAACELWTWRTTAEGRLAEIIVLDQFSRNIYRNQAAAFSNDALALALAQEMVAQGLDKRLSTTQRSFIYMPYMHSESLKVQAESLRLFKQPGLEQNYDFAVAHQVIIERFGRYPHRNSLLNRRSTPEEIAFLKEPGSSF